MQKVPKIEHWTNTTFMKSTKNPYRLNPNSGRVALRVILWFTLVFIFLGFEASRCSPPPAPAVVGTVCT
jgi:hypothetical protein